MVTFANIMFSLYFCLVGKEKNRPREKVAERSTKSGIRKDSSLRCRRGCERVGKKVLLLSRKFLFYASENKRKSNAK